MTKLQVINNVTANTSFQAKPIGVQTSTNPSDKTLSTTTKVVIGTALTALAATGIYIATRGKVKPKTPTPPLEGTTNPVQEIKELAVNAFKEIGAFNKGKAVLADGTNYTGKIVNELKDGSKVVMEYLDGVLQKSTKIKDSETVFEKTYKYSDELGLVKVRKNGKSIFTKDYDKSSKQILINDGRVIVDTETGIVINKGRYIDKETGLTGRVDNFTVTTSVHGDPDYIIKIHGKKLPGGFDVYQANIDTNRALVTQRASSNFDNLGNEGIELRTYYEFDTTGKYRKRYKISGGYGQYEDLTYNSASGIVKNGDVQLFRYNPRNKEITELTIDNNLAQQIVEHGEKHFKFLKKATKAWSNAH